jgi:hypothetical protein
VHSMFSAKKDERCWHWPWLIVPRTDATIWRERRRPEHQRNNNQHITDVNRQHLPLGQHRENEQ